MWQAWGCMCSLGKVLAGKGCFGVIPAGSDGGMFPPTSQRPLFDSLGVLSQTMLSILTVPAAALSRHWLIRWQWCSFSYNLTSRCSVGNERGLKTISPFCCTLCPSISLKLNWARTSPLFLSLLLQGYLRARRGLCLFLSTVGAVCREVEATRW